MYQKYNTENGQLIQASMATLLAGRTTFVIAHRLPTIRRADMILHIYKGRIMESVTHESLVACGGVYHDMVVRQMATADEAVAEPMLASR